MQFNSSPHHKSSLPLLYPLPPPPPPSPPLRATPRAGPCPAALGTMCAWPSAGCCPTTPSQWQTWWSGGCVHCTLTCWPFSIPRHEDKINKLCLFCHKIKNLYRLLLNDKGVKTQFFYIS